ncbi:NAD(P)H-quinone oxidoreductase [Rhodocytophaga aerolata]|uniref:NAD(P)H-quinone oxidoreductase n=1 Tax=Rhodocytophaga aerolata TaxID=455078 RepID=A0ABT8RDB1_9BACT|nr:NAD(P)H-quinone oxidoreductase [Rhodocytophaga aerolata]MDO1450093.1 NAD(P)H-quinone oxidoreductase [Rhodocytophaga aerolata]
MQAVVVPSPGGPEQLQIGSWQKPVPAARQLLVQVEATALNRADTLQRAGKYPPPPGASPILGLEIAGRVVELGNEAIKFNIGDAVFGLLPGGGYAQYAVIHEDMAIPIPEGMSMEQAAAIPEVFLTAFQALRWLANLQATETILIHAGASGVGTAAIQLAKQMGAEIVVTASEAKHGLCKELGATHVIDYKKESFSKVVADVTEGRGVNVIIDFIAANYFTQNIDSLATDGRLVLLATLSGGKVNEFDLRKILTKRLSIIGSTLRSRSLEYQIKLTKDFTSFAFPHFKDGRLKPVIDSIMDWTQVQEAHRLMESNKNAGKIVLKVGHGS